MKKIRVGVIYGGRSGEHEVSLASAAAVFKNLDAARYEALPIRIEKNGRWSLPGRPPVLVSAADVIHGASGADRAEAPEAQLVAWPGAGAGDSTLISGVGLDVVFPVLHGPYGGAGTVPGLLELANVPYLEAGVPDAREIECAVLGNDEPDASVPGESIPSREFYDYEAKYLDAGSKTLIPAPLTEAQADDVRTLAVGAFKAIDGAGMARVDF